MKEETITKYIDQLAQSLNVASEHVYEALIKQAMVSGIMYIVWASVMFGLVAICYKAIVNAWRRADEDSWYDTGDATIFSIPTAFGLAVALIWGLCATEFALTALLNPEYWAIKEVLDAVKN